jgi:hypothetical protein
MNYLLDSEKIDVNVERKNKNLYVLTFEAKVTDFDNKEQIDVNLDIYLNKKEFTLLRKKITECGK